jgi:hypothetical protein
MKRAFFAVLCLVLCSAAVAQASDHCRRNTTRYYYSNSGSNCRQNYSRNYDYRRNYGSSCGSQRYYGDRSWSSSNSCGGSYYSAPTATVCSPMVSYSYRPAPRVVYYERVCRSRNRGLTITIELR